MSVYRRGRIYWIKLSTESGPIRESSGSTDKREAQAFHEKRKSEIWRQEKLGEAPPVTWGEAVATWLKVKERSLPERYMIATLGLPPATLLPLPTEKISAAVTTKSAGSWNRYLSLVQGIHSCVGLQTSPIKRRQTTPGRTRWLTAEEWQRLRKHLSGVMLDLADFSIATGVRENNALNLEWSQVDLRRRVAWFYADQMKGRVSHGIPLNDGAMAVLEARRGIHKRYVFPNPDTGLPYVKASNRAWYAALKDSRLKGTGVVWHTLRHTWASWFVMNGGSLQELMALGGWKSYSMVLRYAHLAPEHLAVAAARVKPISLRYNQRKARAQGTT
jgi:integrase